MLKKLFALLLVSVLCPLFAPAIKAEPAQTIQYKQEDVVDTSTARRKRAQVGINLLKPDQAFTPEQLAATCAAAAKYYAQEYGLQLVGVFISDMPGQQSWEGTRLAQCQYSPDNGGASGDQGWTWDRLQVADKPLTDKERQMKKLWGELRGKYQKNGSTDEEALSKAIAKKMKIKADDVTLPYLFLNNVDAQKYADVEPQGPAEETAPEMPALTAKQLHKEVAQLLKELDGFKNSDTFKQCMYGCGANNPGHAWNEKRKALQEAVTQDLEANPMLKAAPANLFMLGKAYFSDNAKDIKYFRGMIKEGLKK